MPEGLSGERSAWEGAPYGSLYEFDNPSVSRSGWQLPLRVDTFLRHCHRLRRSFRPQPKVGVQLLRKRFGGVESHLLLTVVHGCHLDDNG